jgi:3-methyladenine DNA glycosylase AlkD
MNAVAAYLNAVETALVPLRDERRAVAMAAYMKNCFAFLGIPTLVRRGAVKQILKPDPQEVHGIMRALWTWEQREYQYVALDLLVATAKKLDAKTTLGLIRELALAKSWWDSVDGLAGIGRIILFRHPELRYMVREWGSHDSFWVNRLAILHQLGWRDATDTSLLFELCLAHAHSKEFFVRKAIGWALRDYAWTNPDAVRGFVEENRGKLSNLSVREALKNISRT